VTNPKRVNAPVWLEAALAAVRKLATVFRVLRPGTDVTARTIALAQSIKAKGPEIFDVAIAATAFEHGMAGSVDRVALRVAWAAGVVRAPAWP
jgi:predicted nucleic acid-binding protein